MFTLKNVLSLSVARKLINWATAVGLVIFVIAHLVGNLAIFVPDEGESFNAYAAFLHSLGPGFYVIEIGLLALFVFHIGSGIQMALANNKARKTRYAGGHKSKKGPSHHNLSSTTMAISGVLIAIFVIVHVAQFRFGLFSDVALREAVDAQNNHNLYGMVADAFANPIWVGFYCIFVLFLGWHLRHGLWSMLHSVGSMNRGGGKTSYAIALVVAGLLALGFFVLPIYIHLQVS